MKKKRIISLVMTLCLMVSLFAGMATAEAATEVKDNLYYYTMKAGQTVASICKELGVDFDANQKIIAYLNGYPKWSNMSIGTVVKIPTKDYKYTAAATTTTTTAGTTVTTATGNIQAGDYIAYYLVPYTLQQGDYLSNVCAALGSNYTTNASLIKRVNGLANVDKVMAGKTIYIPCPSVPAGTASALAVVAHKVGQGEIALNICDSYGVGYNANVAMLQALNNNTNLNKITSGSIFYLPVSASAASGITGGGSGTGTGTASNLSSEQYAVKSANSPNGSFEMRINGKKVTSANAGATIEVFAIANSGYSLSNIIVTDKDGNNLKVNGKTFPPLWKPPYRVDLTDALAASGKTVHAIRIKVSNTWANRLIGDTHLPQEKRVGKTFVAVRDAPRKSPGKEYTVYSGFCRDDALFPCGLLGPIQLLGSK